MHITIIIQVLNKQEYITFAGNLLLVEKKQILWSLQVDHQLFSLKKLDVTVSYYSHPHCIYTLRFICYTVDVTLYCYNNLKRKSLYFD